MKIYFIQIMLVLFSLTAFAADDLAQQGQGDPECTGFYCECEGLTGEDYWLCREDVEETFPEGGGDGNW